MAQKMSSEEARAAIKSLSKHFDNYAKLLVRVGAAVENGQEFVVTCPVDAADFCRRVVREGYAAGASHVTVIWTDDETTKLDYLNAPLEFFEHTPSWKIEQMNSLAKQGACFLSLLGTDPGALKGVDPAKPAAAMLSRNSECDVWRHGLDYGDNAWSLGGVATPGWAMHVFPDASPDEALYRLWLAILEASRAMGEDPISDWETHDAGFEKNKRLLNDHHFSTLHFTSSNGTDLELGLPDRHIWGGGSHHTNAGHTFMPNIPTEEVFTAPDRIRADGVVHASMPLVHAGQVVKGFWFQLSDGQVVDYGAEQGKDVLDHIFEMDEGAKRLGEVALVSKNSPIKQSGLLFYNTLFDENASCHIALGKGYLDNIEGSDALSDDELLEAGLNQSHAHVDFMIGTDDLSVVGATANGDEIPVFVNGQWAWE